MTVHVQRFSLCTNTCSNIYHIIFNKDHEFNFTDGIYYGTKTILRSEKKRIPMPLNIKTVINISEPFRSGSAVVHQTISFPH